MKISSVRIQNFRCFSDETVNFNDYSCLVGPNGAGKSTILTALNVFFRESEGAPTNLYQLGEEDFHLKDTTNPIRITVTFEDLSEDAERDFSDYARQGKLIISALAHFNEDRSIAEVKQYGERLGMEAFAQFFALHGDKGTVPQLRPIYADLRKTFPDLPSVTTKVAMYDALRAYETEHPDDCVLIPSEDQFYGFSKGKDRLIKHVQWIYVPAVKDPTSEQVEARNSALGTLLAHTVRRKANFDDAVNKLRRDTQDRYQTLLDDNQQALGELSEALQARLSQWAHPDARLRLEWKQDPDKSVRVDRPFAHILAGEGEFEGELARFGHGLQRSYLLALLSELAETDIEGDAPCLILACEEPELYQHPPQARHLANVLYKLGGPSSQVLVSTHNPLFVTGEGFESVRMVRKESGASCSSVSQVTFETIAEEVSTATNRQPYRPEGMLAKINRALQPTINEMFFTNKLVLVEGVEDRAYILAYLNLMDNFDEYRRLGCHIVPTNGKSNLLQPLIIAKHLKIPSYVVFDADSDTPEDRPHRVLHRRDNLAILSILGVDQPEPFPDDNVTGTNFTMWHTNISRIVEEEIGSENWRNYRNQADALYGNAGNLRKNELHVAACLAFAWNDGHRSVSLEELCSTVLRSEAYGH